MERKTCNESEISFIKAWIKQTRINKLGKYPYNKKQRSRYIFWNPAGRSSTRSWNQNQSVMGLQWGQGPWKRFPCIQICDVLCYKPIPIIYRTSLLQNSLKVIVVCDYVKECIFLNVVDYLVYGFGIGYDV